MEIVGSYFSTFINFSMTIGAAKVINGKRAFLVGGIDQMSTLDKNGNTKFLRKSDAVFFRILDFPS